MPTNLTIPEIKGNFYGGFPYSVDLTVGTFDSPSTLSISVINENGIYSEPVLSYRDILTIKIGSLTFNGYLVEYKKNKSVGQKILDLFYEDCSNILDKIQVGLHRRHGVNPNGFTYSPTMNYQGQLSMSNLNIQKNPYLIILGKELNPCDINKNGIIDSQDIEASKDWCDPCPECPPEKYKYRCSSISDLKILDVAYSFRDLCEYLGIPTPNITSIDTILRKYTGSLRSVLQAWCNEFALSFYWNFGAKDIQAGLVLFDRSVPITINTSIDECTVTEILEGKSIKNNFASSAISYYQRDGNNKSYPCTKSEFYVLHALRYRDLINPGNYADVNTNIRWMELAICLSYYSSSLRDCLWWFNYYQIADSTKANQWIDKILPFFGNMKIKQVIDSSNSGLFSECKLQLGDAIKDYTAGDYYFFIAEFDRELLQSQYSREEELAKNFIGNHWIKTTNGPGCDGSLVNMRYGGISIDDPEGNSTWHSATSDSVFGDFVKFGHENNSKIDSFLKNNNVSMQETQVQKSFIYKKRTSSWWPGTAEMSNYAEVIKYYQSLCWNLVDTATEGNDSKFLSSINSQYAGNKNIALFIVKNSVRLPITISSINNYLEPNSPKVIRGNPQENEVCISMNDANKNANRDTGPILGSYGLMDNQSAWVTFDGFSFMAPTQATELTNTISSSVLDNNPSFTTAGYKVRATTSFNIPVCIPKIQQSVVQISDQISRAPRHELSFMDISDDDLTIFGSQSCVPNAEVIKGIHKAQSAAISKSKIGPEKMNEYKMVGVAPDGIPSVGQGLDSIKISVTDNGVFTNFSLSDKIAKPFSEETILNQVLMARQMQKSNYPTINDYAIKNAGNSTIPTNIT